MVGLGRWLSRVEQHERALVLFRRALAKGLRDDLMFRTLWDIARLEKKLGKDEAAIGVFAELANCKNEFRLGALEELAKHYEHKQRNYSMALEFTLHALIYGSSESLLKRRVRLEKRTARRAAAGSLL
ncbi:MAG: hypothetical protein WKF37_16410 [Bryobacteraceae bacterium]